MKTILGIDIGTSGTKTILVDDQGRVIAAKTIEYPMETPKPGWTQQNPQDWWAASVESIRAVLAKANVPAQDIAAIGLSGQMHGMVALDEHDQVVRPAILWNDQRTEKQCEEITEAAGGLEELLKLTNNRMLTGYTGGKILWMKENEPENFAKTRVILNPKDYIPAVYGYYSTADGRMLSYPFNSSTTVLYLNLTKFKNAGLPTEPDKLPRTWPEIEKAAKALKAAGETCPMTTSWMGWTQLESFSTWHNVEYATLNNGFGGTGARLMVNSPLHQRHLENLARMAKEGTFVYKGRGNLADATFYSGECAINMGSSGSLGNIRRNAKFEYMTMPMPYYEGVPDAPQNTAIGGASLWAMAGKSDEQNRCVAEFFHYLSDPQVQANNHMRTGYLPVTQKAFEIAKASGYYEKNPGADVAVKQMLKTTDKSRGIRLGYLPNIRTIVDEEFEKIWSGKATAKEALDAVVRRGNEQLVRFERVTK